MCATDALLDVFIGECWMHPLEREAIKSGLVESPFSKYNIDRVNERSNLDGAPATTKWAPKFYEVIGFGPYLYVASRWDGLWIFELENSGAVTEVGKAGQPSIVSSTRLLRRQQYDPSFIPSHQSYRLDWDGEVLYVAGWHNADAYRLVSDDPDDDPEIWLSGQRTHFSADPVVSPETLSFQITNAGEGVLNISEVICPSAIGCNLDSAVLQTDDTIELRLSYNGRRPDLQTKVDIVSNDPDDVRASIFVFTTAANFVDPQEAAPDFTGNFVTYDYVTQSFSQSVVDLSDFTDAEQVMHLGFFGGFCPACAWKGTSIAADVTAKLPPGVMSVLIDPLKSQAPSQHIMEKVHIPVAFLFSSVGERIYRQPDNWGGWSGLPAFRDYAVNTAGTVTAVLGQEYRPDRILTAIEGAVNGGPPPTDGADLSVSKSDSPDPAQVGETLTYTLQVRNTGPDSATGVVLTDTLPTDASYLSASAGQGSCAQGGGVVTCSLGTVTNGGLVTVTVLITPTVEGSINNTASVAASETDPSPTNNTASVITTVGTPSQEPLNIIDVSPDVLAIGSVAQLTVTGTGFEAGASAVVCRTGGVTIDAIQVVNANTILIDVTVAADLSPKTCGVRIINPDGETDTLLRAFRIE